MLNYYYYFSGINYATMKHPLSPTFSEVIETDFATFFLNVEEDTLLIRYRESTNITLEIAKEALTVIKPFKDAGSKYAIIDFSAKFISITNEAKNHFKENVAPHNTKLVAVIVDDAATKVIANFYARFDKPKVITRVFNDIEIAVNWINELK